MWNGSIRCLAIAILIIGCAPLSESENNKTEANASSQEPRSEFENQELANNNPMNDEYKLPADYLVSAEIILVSATGQELTEGTLITSENINEYLPASETVDAVSHYFSENQFEVLFAGGISLSITGTHEQFSNSFNAILHQPESGQILIMDKDGQPLEAFRLDNLPEDVQEKIVSIILVSPPEFFGSAP